MRRRSLSARWLVLVTVCLGFGAVVNFGMGWWCIRWYERAGGNEFAGAGAAWSGFSAAGPRPAYYVDLRPTEWAVRVPEGWPRAPKFGQREEFPSLTRTTEYADWEDKTSIEYRRVIRIDAGLPLRCWWCADRMTMPMGGGAMSVWTHEHTGALSFPPQWAKWLGVSKLAIGVHPWSVLVNTLAYASVPAVMWVGTGVVRRWWRGRSGRCVGCGYELVGLKEGVPCPECGRGR